MARIDARNQRALESLAEVDRQIARIVDALRDKGELGNTYLLFTSDNGYLDGEHRIEFGKLLAQQGRYTEAVPCFRAAATLEPRYVEYRRNLGLMLARLGRLDDALEQFQQAIRIQPNDSEAHCNLGNVLLAQGRFGDAMPEFRAALKSSPDFVTAHFGLGAALLNLAQTDEAIAQ